MPFHKNAPRRSGREWSANDMKVMRECAKKRISARITAGKLGRSPGAVRYKAMVEGVNFRSINRKAA
jgi:hypothetical protein